MKTKDNVFLAICDKPAQIAQLVAFERVEDSVNFVNYGANLVVVLLDTLGNNSSAVAGLKEGLNDFYLFNATIVQYDLNDIIYKGDYSGPNGLRQITAFIRETVHKDISAIFCSLLSQRFVKIHLDAYPKAPIYMLEDGLASHLEMSVKDCQAWGAYYTHQGIVLSHVQRLAKSIVIPSGDIPRTYNNFRTVSIDFANNLLEEHTPISNVFVGLNQDKHKIIADCISDYWHKKSQKISIPDGHSAVLIGQNLSDFTKDFFFRNEIELYVALCEKMLQKFEKIIFAPHPKASDRTTVIMQKLLSKPDNVYFFDSRLAPVEALFVLENAPQYAVGLYSSSLWNLKNILGLENVYTALGWDTIKLYQELVQDIQKQAYKKARQDFYSLNKLLGEI